MRLCRFLLDDVILAGFYLDDRVVPIDQAAEARGAADETSDFLDPSADLLDDLPPRGASEQAVRDLDRWLNSQPPDVLDELSIPIDQVELLAPIERPGKILMIARNYPDHSVEQGDIAAERAETFPYVFLKPDSTLSAPDAPIVLPRLSPHQIDWECELGVIIGAECRHVREEDALNYVAGYTVLNDVSDRGFKPNPGRKKRERDAFFDWLHGKWHDGSCPVGPCVLAAGPGVDPARFRLRLSVNGQSMQDATAEQMIFPVTALIAFLSSIMTLHPGDLIGTGTPAGVGKARGQFLKAGDEVRASIDPIGTLRNPVELEA